MATITDLNGNSNTVTDNNLLFDWEDSNVNVFEFGNLILADLFPTLTWVQNMVNDNYGNTLTVTDGSGNSLSVIDSSGSVGTVIDMSGS